LYLVVGPLLLLYTKKILQIPLSRKWINRLHFLPAGIFYCLIFLLNISVSTEELRTYLLEDSDLKGIDAFGVAIQIQVGLYVLASFWNWYRFESAVKKEYSSDFTLSMNWLKQALIIFLLLWSVWVAGDFLLDTSFAIATDFAMVVGVYFLGYSALIHKNILLPSLKFADVEVTQTPAREAPVRYANAKLSDERTAKLQQALSTLMLTEHPYLEPELTLSQLASSLQATNHDVSQLLNEALGESFFDFINRHRVAEVQRCLRDPAYRQQTILDIAFASGFSSKAAFNAAFKKVSGLTPSQYKAAQT
jgi:AraC-like DNA-binding protein